MRNILLELNSSIWKLRTLLALCVSAIAVQAQPSHYFSDLVSYTFARNYIKSNDSILVVLVPQVGVFSGPADDQLTSLLTAEETVSYRSILVDLSTDGTIVVVGQDKYEDRGTVHVWKSHGLQHSKTESTAIQGLIFPSRIYDGDVNVFDSSTIRVFDAYSTNSGATWNVVHPPPEVAGWNNVYYHETIGFYAYALINNTRRAWYSLDINNAKWSPMDVPENTTELRFLGNGRSIAVVEQYDWRSGLHYRDEVNAGWKQIETIARADGKLITVGSFPGIGPLVDIDEHTVVALLDSGVAVVFGANSIDTVSLPEETYTLSLRSRGLSGADAYRGSIVASYSNGFLCVLDVNKSTTPRVFRPSTRSMDEVDFINGNVVGLSLQPTRILYRLDTSNNVWSLSGRVIESSLVHPNRIEFSSLDEFNNVVHLTTATGCIAVVHDEMSASMLNSPLIPIPEKYVGESRLLFNNRRVLSYRNGILMAGSALYAVNSDSTKLLFADTCTTISSDGQDNILAGYRQLLSTVNGGKTWDTVEISGRSQSSDGIISTIATSKNIIVVGTKGYTRTAGGEVLHVVSGGMYTSSDGGNTWNHVVLPVKGQWVDNIEIISDQLWLAWISDMELVGDQTPGALRAFYRNSAYLLASSDMGQTWNISLDAEHTRAKANCSGWGIHVVHGNTSIVVSSDDAVYTTATWPPTWNVVDRVSRPDYVVGAVIREANNILIATNTELYSTSLTTGVNSPISIGTSTPMFDIGATPNPSNGVATIHLRSLEQLRTAPSLIAIVDETGRVFVDLTSAFADRLADSHTDIQVDIRALSDGMYFLVCASGSNRVCKPFPKLTY